MHGDKHKLHTIIQVAVTNRIQQSHMRTRDLSIVTVLRAERVSVFSRGGPLSDLLQAVELRPDKLQTVDSYVRIHDQLRIKATK